VSALSTRGRATEGALAAFRSRDFVLFWIGAIVSNTGTWMQTVTVPYVLDQLTHSTAVVGFGVFCTFFPMTVVGPLAGSLADRHSRRTVLLWAQSVMMLAAFALYALWITGTARAPSILACVVVSALAAGITNASWQAFVPQLVPTRDMLSAVRLNSMQFTGARAFGPALAGIVLATFGPGAAFLANALSFLVVIGALLAIIDRPIGDADEPGPVLSHFRDGLRYVRSRTALALVVSIAFAFTLLGVSVTQLLEPFARRVFHLGAGRYGVMVGAVGAGAIVGALVIVAFGGTMRRSRMVLMGLGVAAATQLVLGLAPTFAVAVAVLVVLGAAHVYCTTGFMTSLQVNVRESFRGRVMSIFLTAFFLGAPLGALLGGVAAELVGLRATAAGAAVLLGVLVLVGAVRFHAFRSLDGSLDPAVERGGEWQV
jgi:MFS family permease